MTDNQNKEIEEIKKKLDVLEDRINYIAMVLLGATITLAFVLIQNASR